MTHFIRIKVFANSAILISCLTLLHSEQPKLLSEEYSKKKKKNINAFQIRLQNSVEADQSTLVA